MHDILAYGMLWEWSVVYCNAVEVIVVYHAYRQRYRYLSTIAEQKMGSAVEWQVQARGGARDMDMDMDMDGDEGFRRPWEFCTAGEGRCADVAGT